MRLSVVVVASVIFFLSLFLLYCRNAAVSQLSWDVIGRCVVFAFANSPSKGIGTNLNSYKTLT